SDCDDSSDELDCTPVPCQATEFDCGDECIPESWVCDDASDCNDGSDEVGCPSCLDTQFACTSGECIDLDVVCDLAADCADGSDELDCG
ncbi:MAG TPA: hypothetical protein VM686_20635, partial [Polyangiaceae bacterium]|nr:hypothetical protein [Polyangiaceae bacterium]